MEIGMIPEHSSFSFFSYRPLRSTSPFSPLKDLDTFPPKIALLLREEDLSDYAAHPMARFLRSWSRSPFFPLSEVQDSRLTRRAFFMDGFATFFFFFFLEGLVNLPIIFPSLLRRSTSPPFFLSS